WDLEPSQEEVREPYPRRRPGPDSWDHGSHLPEPSQGQWVRVAEGRPPAGPGLRRGASRARMRAGRPRPALPPPLQPAVALLRRRGASDGHWGPWGGGPCSAGPRPPPRPPPPRPGP